MTMFPANIGNPGIRATLGGAANAVPAVDANKTIARRDVNAVFDIFPIFGTPI